MLLATEDEPGEGKKSKKPKRAASKAKAAAKKSAKPKAVTKKGTKDKSKGKKNPDRQPTEYSQVKKAFFAKLLR